MSNSSVIDEPGDRRVFSSEFQRDYLVRLPLPLAQLYGRAHNAKDARSRHDNTFYLFEALIKLAAAPGVAAYLDEVDRGSARIPALDALLVSLASPSLGQWVAIHRETARHFGRRPDAATHPLGHHWKQLDEPRKDRPALLALFRRIKNGPDGAPVNDQSCSVLQVLEALVQYRNLVFGHGGPRFEGFYADEMGPLLFPAANELLAEGVFDPLGPRGSRLVQLVELRVLDEGRVEVGISELIGLQAERSASLFLDRDQALALEPNRVAVLWPGRTVPLRLDPLLVYRAGELADEVLFLNRDRNGRQVEYLSYTTGRTERDRSTAAALAALLGRVTGREVTEDQVRNLAEQSLAETPSVETLLGPSPQPGTIRGDYAILAEIGRGGMGVVFLARQLSLGRLVALKMLPSDLAGNEVALARFRREMRVLARCEHPNIVKVLASGSMPEGALFYAMEYVPGCDLEQVWKELSGSEIAGGVSTLGSSTWTRAVLSASRKTRDQLSRRPGESSEAVPLRLPPLPDLPSVPDDPGGYIRRVVALLRDAALALQAVHDQGVIHRDVKPANLILTPDGSRVVLMDFGLAKGESLSLTESRAGGLLGTLRYAAPEQLAAASIQVGPQADVRGLGVTLWEMLTRKRLFGEAQDEGQLAAMVLARDVPSLRSVDPLYDRDLEAIVTRATERAAADRIDSPGQLAEYLQLYLDGQPLPIRPPTTGEMVRRWVRDHRPQVAAALTALAGIIVASGIAFYLVNRSRDRAVVALADSESNAYFHTISLANEAMRKHRIGEAEALLESCPVHLRGWEWHYLRNRCVGPLFTMHQHRDRVHCVAFSRDGTMGASASVDEFGHVTVLVWDAVTGDVIAEHKGHDSSLRDMEFSPNGRYVASMDEQKLAIWEARTGSSVKEYSWRSRSIVSFDDDGKPRTELEDPSGARDVQPVTWDRDWIVWRQFYNFILRTPDDSRPFALGPALNAVTNQIAVLKLGAMNSTVLGEDPSPDSSRRRLTVFDSNRKRQYSAELERGDLPGSPDFSPDGTRLGALGSRPVILNFSGTESTSFARIPIWDSATGKLLMTIESDQPSGSRVRFSRDGRWLVAETGGHLTFWDARTLQERYSIGSNEDGINTFAIDPLCRRLVLGGAQGMLAVWSLADLVPSMVLRDHSRESTLGRCVAIDPGETVAVAGYSDGVVALWDLRDGAETILGRHDGSVSSVDVSKDGKLAATCGEDGKTRIWDINARKELIAVQEPGVTFSAVAFGMSDKVVATSGGDRAVRIWSTRDGRRQRLIDSDSYVTSVRFSPDGRTLAWSSGRTVVVADAESGQVRWKRTGHTDLVARVCFSPSGHEVASCGDDGTIRIDSLIGGATTILRGHLREVSAIAYSPDGRRLASAGPDGSFRIWDVPHGREVINLSPFENVLYTAPEIAAIRDIAFGPDGRKIALCSHGGSIVVLDATPKPRGQSARTKWVAHDAARNEAAENWADARFYLTQLVEADPRNPQLRLRRGLANLRLQRWREAEQDYSAAIQEGVAIADAYRGKARAELHIGQAAKAIVDCDRALAMEPGKPDLTMLKYLACSLLGQKTAAEREYSVLAERFELIVPRHDQWWSERFDGFGARDRELRKVFFFDLDGLAKAEPESTWLYRAWGIYHAAYGVAAAYGEAIHPWETAADAFSSALKLNPEDRESLRGRARAWSELGDWEKVENDCNLALRLDPGGWDLWYLRGRAREKLGRISEAAADYRQAIERGGVGPETWSRLAELLRQLGRPAEAVPLYVQALTYPGDNDFVAQLWFGLGTSRASIGQFSEAIADLAKSIDLPSQSYPWIRPGDERAIHWRNLAMAFLATGDSNGFRSTCERFFQRSKPADSGPNEYDEEYLSARESVLHTLAFTSLHRPDSGVDLRRLVSYSEWAVERKRGSADYRETLGAALYRTEWYRESLEQLNEAVRLQGQGGSMWTQFFLAMAYQRLGRTNEAREWLARAVAQSPSASVDANGACPNWAEVARYRQLRMEAESLIVWDPIFPERPFAR